jgi:predicted nucleic acid-binding Zn ribbon protein
MPLYEYECQKCGHKFEKIMKMDASNPPCILALKTNRQNILERCDGETKRLISLNNFHLKGGGWYKDGYEKKQQ